ncbi:MAG: serine hydrolase [Paludibacter sp.]|nr:serine hydrolase [Paludibacter sp.]
MNATRKPSVKKILLYLLLVVVAGAAVFLLLPQNYYVHRALIYQLPKIHHYQIFENREVKANDPKPWEMAENAHENLIAAQYVEDFARYESVAFLVIKNNRIISEQYWDDYGPQSLSNSFSMSKSIVSLLVGCAISDGFIKSVDQPVSDFLPAWTSFDGKVLTIKDLLTMSAGVKWDESHSSLFSKTTEAYYGKDLWKLTQTEVLEARPGEHFNYQSGVTQILAFLLQKATGKNVSEYASEKIWTPINAEEDALWSLDKKDGIEKAYCCFNTNARDFARLGQLVLNNGKWNGRQVVDSAYIREAVTPASWLKFTRRLKPGETVTPEPVPNQIYGYQFWIVNYKGLTIPYMRGILGQYIFVIPELDAVIVRLGRLRDKEYVVEQSYTKDMEVWLDAALEILNRN